MFKDNLTYSGRSPLNSFANFSIEPVIPLQWFTLKKGVICVCVCLGIPYTEKRLDEAVAQKQPFLVDFEVPKDYKLSYYS